MSVICYGECGGGVGGSRACRCLRACDDVDTPSLPLCRVTTTFADRRWQTLCCWCQRPNRPKNCCPVSLRLETAYAGSTHNRAAVLKQLTWCHRGAGQRLSGGRESQRPVASAPSIVRCPVAATRAWSPTLRQYNFL